MLFGVTWLDAMLVVLLIVVLVQGYRRGLWIVAGTMLGTAAGALGGFYLIPFVSGWVSEPSLRVGVLIAATILLIWLGQRIGVGIGRRIRLHVNRPALRRVDRFLGAGAAVVVSVMILGLTALSLNSLGMAPVTREINRSAVLTATDRIMPDGSQRFLSESRAAIAGIGVIPEIDTPVKDVAAPAPDATPSASLTVPEGQQARIQDSVVRLSGFAEECAQTQNGTGVVVAKDRILTNAHVVAGVDEPIVETQDRQVFPGRVVHIDAARDLAVVAVDGADLPVARHGADLAEGEAALALGFPAGGPYVATPAEVQARGELLIGDIYGRQDSTVDIYQLYADIEPGASGGPLVTEDGTVAGLVFARAPGSSTIGYAIAGDEFEQLLEDAENLDVPVAAGECIPGG
jgi:S1-C subfamily serine protease